MDSLSKAAVVLLAVVIATGSGCRKSSGTPAQSASPASGSGFAKVTYQPYVHIVGNEEGKAALDGVSSDGNAFIFNASNPQLASLKAGDALLIKGLLAKRVIAAERRGPQVVVLTQPASIPDIVKQGEIRVDAPIRFGGLKSQMKAPGTLDKLAQMTMPTLVPTAYAQSPESVILGRAEQRGTRDAFNNMVGGIKGAVINGWKTDFHVVPEPNRLNLSLVMTKDVGGFRALITGEGYLTDFEFSSDILVDPATPSSTETLPERGYRVWTQKRNAVYRSVEASYKKVNGAMNFKWEVAKDTPGVQTGDDRIKLPAAIEIPLYEYLEGLPLFLEISSALIIKPAISGGKEYSRGAFRVTYDGYQHFKVKEGNIDSDGTVNGDIQFLESQNISALAPMGMVVAFAAPRIELTFGVSKVFKFEDMKEAAEKVDAIAEELGKRVLGKEAWEQFKSSPLGGVTIGKAVENALKSDATAYFEFVSSSGMSFSGMSAIAPCTRTDIHLLGKVGADAQMFGQKVGSSEKEVFKKDFTRIDPPGTRLCESAG